MARNPLTSKERRGLTALLAAALIISFAGWFLSRSGNNTPAAPAVPAAEILTDHAAGQQPDTSRQKRLRKKRKIRASKKKRKSEERAPAPRDFLNDTIPVSGR